MVRLARASALLLAAAALAGFASRAQAQVVITDSTGSFSVGIHTSSGGELYNPATGTGIRRISDGYDPLAPGTPRDSWGVAADAVNGYADAADFGVKNLVANGSSSTASTAFVSEFLNAGAGNLLKIDQSYSFAAANVLKIATTLTNVSGAAIGSVLFQRGVDWDVAPTLFDEITTAPGPTPPITDASSYGFENPNPLSAFISSVGGGGTFGPGDLGAAYKVALGGLADGASTTFDVFYAISQVGQSESGLASEIAGLGGSYVITTKNSGAYVNSAALAFGVPSGPGPSVPEPGTYAAMGIGLIGMIGTLLKRRAR